MSKKRNLRISVALAILLIAMVLIARRDHSKVDRVENPNLSSKSQELHSPVTFEPAAVIGDPSEVDQKSFTDLSIARKKIELERARIEKLKKEVDLMPLDHPDVRSKISRLVWAYFDFDAAEAVRWIASKDPNDIYSNGYVMVGSLIAKERGFSELENLLVGVSPEGWGHILLGATDHVSSANVDEFVSVALESKRKDVPIDSVDEAFGKVSSKLASLGETSKALMLTEQIELDGERTQAISSIYIQWSRRDAIGSLNHVLKNVPEQLNKNFYISSIIASSAPEQLKKLEEWSRSLDAETRAGIEGVLRDYGNN